MTLFQPFQIYILGTPIAQPRQRHSHRNGITRNYVPKSHSIWGFKAAAKMAAQSVYHGDPLTMPLCVDIELVFPRPKSMIWKRKPMPRALYPCEPDKDNAFKGVYDALNGIVWMDDRIICDGRERKLYAAGDEEPHTLLTISEAVL